MVTHLETILPKSFADSLTKEFDENFMFDNVLKHISKNGEWISIE